MIEVISNAIRYSGRFFAISLGSLLNLAILNPLHHISAVTRSPANAIQILLIGPIVGTGVFLSNPKSIFIGAAACFSAFFIAPGLSVGYLAALGFGANAVFGFGESVATRIRNERELYENSTGMRHYDFDMRKSLVEEKFPNELGPIAKGLHFDFLTACKTSFDGFRRPYRKYEVYYVPESQGGLDPVVMRKH